MKYSDLFTSLHEEAREPKQYHLIWSENHEHASRFHRQRHSPTGEARLAGI